MNGPIAGHQSYATDSAGERSAPALETPPSGKYNVDPGFSKDPLPAADEDDLSLTSYANGCCAPTRCGPPIQHAWCPSLTLRVSRRLLRYLLGL